MNAETPNASNSSKNSSSSNDLIEALNKNMQEMSLLREQISTITTQLSQVLNRVQAVENENVVLKTALQENENKIAALEQKLTQQEENKKRIDKMEINQQRTDREMRKKQLIIKGSALSYEADNLKTNTVEHLATVLKIPKASLQCSNYKLFGKEGKAILITVQCDEDRLAFFAAARKEKPSNISVNEFLTPDKAKLMYELRKMKYEKKNMRSVFSLGGRVYITYEENGDKFEINDLTDVITINDEAQQTS